jgi:hypothetical protein
MIFPRTAARPSASGYAPKPDNPGRWVDQMGLDPAGYGTHSGRPTEATLIFRRTKNLRAAARSLEAQIDSTVSRRPCASRFAACSRSLPQSSHIGALPTRLPSARVVAYSEARLWQWIEEGSSRVPSDGGSSAGARESQELRRRSGERHHRRVDAQCGRQRWIGAK